MGHDDDNHNSRGCVYSFADVRVDCGRFCVVRDGQALKITPRAFEVLLYLIEHPDRVVEKQELFERVWRESFVTDNALTRMVKEVRRVIGDDADAPRYIETVPKRGYRFIAEVKKESRGDASPAAEDDSVIASIAVLPFVNLSNDADNEYLSEGITESLINTLSRLPNLRVVPRSTVFYFQGKGATPQQAGRELNVRAVLTGRVLQRQETIIIRTELIDVSREAQLWGEEYQRRPSDLFVVQEEISQAISTQLRLKLSAGDREQLSRHYTRDAEAYRLYLKGRYFWNRRPVGLKKGIEYFRQALEQDPSYALAYAGLADSYSTLGSWENGGMPPREAMPKACAAASRALELDPALAEAEATLAYAKLHYDWDWREAERGFTRALELNENYVHAVHWLSHYYMARGRLKDSLNISLRALELDPLDLIINAHLVWHYWLAREPEHALQHAEKTRELDARNIWPSFFAGLAYEQQGLYDEAVKELQKAQELSADVTFVKAALAHALGLSGSRRDARRSLQELESLKTKKYVPAYDMAIAHLGLGDKGRALDWLDKALEERSGWLAYLAVEPRLDELRGETKFSEIVKRVSERAK
jgi:TolB-like protein/Flp pilus assembly protein TadD